MKKTLCFLFIFTLSISISFASRNVIKVVDGDTVKIQKNNSEKVLTVRMIGLDAPEATTTRYGHTECYGEEAKDHLASLLNGKNINLLYDATQGTKDKYGRTLAYLIGDDKTDYNRQMIADGYAKEYTYNTKYKRQGIYKQAQ